MPRHNEVRELPYAANKMFDLVADIESYPEFVPWCRAARIRSRRTTGSVAILVADLLVSIRVFRETLVTNVTLDQERNIILVDYVEGPLRNLHSEWRFCRLPDERSRIEYAVEFEFRSLVLTAFAEVFLDQAISSIVSAFERRADSIFGRAR